tara:strand:+ start:33293 stop:37771 length:4479 start_codon:yes stop_codon:yes gene_type:complete
MNTNHNILIGGAIADDIIREYKNDVEDKLYFRSGKKETGNLFSFKINVTGIKGVNGNKHTTFQVDKKYQEGVDSINEKCAKTKKKFDFKKHYTARELAKIFDLNFTAPLGYLKCLIKNDYVNNYKSMSQKNGITDIKEFIKDPINYGKNKPQVAKKQTKKQTKKKEKKAKEKKNTTKKVKKNKEPKKCTKRNPAPPCNPGFEKKKNKKNEICCYKEKTIKEKKAKPKKKEKTNKSCEELIADMKKFVTENGSLNNIDKSKNEYNDFLQCVEKKNRDDEKKEGEDLEEEDYLLYPLLEDPNFNKKIYNKKEFRDGNKYAERELPEDKSRGEEFEKTVDSICENLEFELLPHQKFIRNYLSFATPYNSLLIYHGLGTGKTCSSIGVAEEFRTYANQMGVNKKIIIVASKLVQDNYRKQLFPEHKLKKVGGLWNIKSCVGNKFIKEINPMNMENLSREDVVKQINVIIRENYEFMAYLEFARQIEKEIKKFSIKEGDDDKQIKIKIQAIRDKYSDRLIVIDEVHNIRDTEIVGNNKKDMDTMKSTTEYFQKLVTYADNLKLLLLTGTPMYNSHEEIIWLLNLMNLNDDRYSIKTTDIFNADGNMTEKGKELLIQKSRGYVSFVQGEDPYLFPFRLYPNDDITMGGYRDNSLKYIMGKQDFSYPTKQMNGYELPEGRDGKRGIKHLDLFITKPGNKQKEGYEGYIEHLINNNLLNEQQENFSYTMLTVPSQLLNICYPKTDKEDWKYRYGSNGLKQIMNYNHSLLNEFEYKENHEGFFKQDNLREYSGKITQIIKEVDRSKGIILIYSQFIEGGCIPVALALEESGYSKHGGSLFKNKKGAIEKKGKYIMITGNKELNKNLKQTMNICNDEDNKNGKDIKVIIISQAGSEGLDFANIRQVHILDAWYNLNRTGQIEGRAIRNQSHCNLKFKDRNVLICLHGTYGLTDNKEAADLYMYRVAEKKAEITGKVARVLKETAIDCKLNENQQNLNKSILNVTRKIVLPRLEDGLDIPFDFNIGHSEKSQICDFMDCEFNCKPNIGEDGEPNIYTYNQKFITLTVTKIIEIIKRLFKEKYMYERKDLIKSIKVKREYKRDEILNALSILINDKTEYIEDNIGRKGRLLNVGDLYLFQPIEIGQEQLTMYQRQHPMPYKANSFMIKLEDFKKKKGDKIDIIKEFFENLEFVFDEKKFENTIKLWEEDKKKLDGFNKKFHYHIKNVTTLLNEKMKIDKDDLKRYSVFKMVDGLKDNFNSKLKLLNIYQKDDMYKENIGDKVKAKDIIKEYFSKYMFMDDEYCIISNFKSNTFDDKSKGQIFVVKKVGDKYEKIKESNMMFYLKKYIREKPIEMLNMNKIYELIGFSSYIDETRKDDIVFRYKKTDDNKVNKGVRCDNNNNKRMSQAARTTLIKLLFKKNPEDFNDVKIAELNKQKKFDHEGVTDKYANITPYDTCLMIEYILRYLNDKREGDKRYFFGCVDTILYGVSELPKKKTIYQDMLIE